jgi:hypothetical protein
MDKMPIDADEILDKMIYHQKVIFSQYNTDIEFLKCLCYHLYKCLLYDNLEIKNISTNVSFTINCFVEKKIIKTFILNQSIFIDLEIANASKTS